MSEITAAHRDKLMADLRTVISDAEEVLKVTADQASAGAAELRVRMQERLDAVVFTRSFASTSDSVRHHLALMNTAASELRGSLDFKLLLQHVLAVGNCMNMGTSKGSAQV